MQPLTIRQLPIENTRALEWLTKAEQRLAACTPAQALEMLPAYLTMHFAAYGTEADNDFVNAIRLAAFRALEQGDQTVNQYLLYSQIRLALDRRDPEFFGDALRWFCRRTDFWHKRLSKAVLPDPDPDTVRQVSILLQADLFAYEGKNEPAFKHRLRTRYAHYLKAQQN